MEAEGLSVRCLRTCPGPHGVVEAARGDRPRDDLKLGDPVLPLMLCDHLGLRILPEE